MSESLSDQTDALLGNAYLDVANLLFKSLGPRCSSLMSWNDATAGTDLDGKSVIARHMDWETNPILYNNNMIIVNFPAEAGEEKWLLVGYAGMMSALSGVNQDFGAFQHQMDDNSSSGLHNKQYLPIWYALRQALEAEDYNGDGNRNVLDVRSALEDCSNGFADGYIISALANSNPVDSLVALVAELAPTNPTICSSCNMPQK
ncbi:MAG: hypothetical protein FJY10_11680 [Bacteroidetes bacterium]|nr:hypothetical protein [Bacteroidota bacterium]